MTREDSIVSDIAGVAALILCGWVSNPENTGIPVRSFDCERAVELAKNLYKLSRRAVRELQAEGDYGPLAGAKEAKP